MTDTAPSEAAPKARDDANLQDTPFTTQPAPEKIVKNGDIHLDTSLTQSSVRNVADLSSDSELSPIDSDLDIPLDLDESVFQTSTIIENATSGDDESDHDINDRPSKRRRVSTPPPQSNKKKAPSVSPPWKKFEADGPTTLIKDGQRRSGRISAAPVATQPQSTKRPTTGGSNDRNGTSTTKGKKPAASSVNGLSNGQRRAVSSGKGVNSKAPPPTAKPATRKSLTNTSKPAPKTAARRRSPSPSTQTSPRRTSERTRSSRVLGDSSPAHETSHDAQESPNISRPTRIKLRLRPATLSIVHPAQVNVYPGQTVARPKIGDNFVDYVQRAPEIDIKDGGWRDPEDEPIYTDEQAEREAKIIMRVENEAQPSGLLSENRCTIFIPEPAEDPPRQWVHMDHLVKAMTNFRKLMLMEQQRHKAAAKRLAEACRDEWVRRQPKSAEKLEEEAIALWQGRYKTVLKALGGTWENVKIEINRRRLEEWQAAEQKRVKAALNEAVNMSELKLQARRAHFDSEPFSDDEDVSDVDESDQEEDEMEDDDEDEVTGSAEEDSDADDESEENESNMSSSDEEEDAKSDNSEEHLTQEQLRQKYANIPDLPPAESEKDKSQEATAVTNEDDNSDESIDMDDDMGSSDEDMDSDQDAGEEDDDEEPAGLLGMLFGKSELKKLEEEAATQDADMPSDQPQDVEMTGVQPMTNGVSVTASNGCRSPSDEEEEVSLVKHADHDNVSADIQKSETTVQASTDRTPTKSTSKNEQVDPPADPLQANKPDVTTAVPKPLDVESVSKEIVDAVEQVENDAVDTPMPDANQDSSAVPSVEVTAAPATTNTSPATDAITGSASRDLSQSPRTSETKPSELDTTSATKSEVSRSTSPQTAIPGTEVPFLLRGTLREYQHYGLDWLAGLYQNKTNGILADEMGLGKTIQTIALLAHLACHHEVWGPHLVIVPTSVMLNWEMEFKKWCPGFKVLSYYGSIEERKRKRQGWKTHDMWNVCITSYQIVLQDHQVFKRRQWHYMILDEAHNIKNFKSKRWQTLLGFNTQARLLLTGTPLQNNLTELWSLLFFLMPSENGVGGFADLAEFQDWFHKPESQILESGREQMDDEARAIIVKLHKVLRPYLLRRLKADVEKQMPAKYEHIEFCRLSRRQRELYDGFLARTDTREALASGNYISVINCLMQLRKVCNHPDLFVERPIMTSFRQRTSVVGEYEPTNHLIKDKLFAEKPMSIVSTKFLNLVPTEYEEFSSTVCERVSQLSAHRPLMELREAQKNRAQAAHTNLDPSVVESNIVYLESAARWGRFEELQHCVYINALRRQQRPIYGKRLRDFLTIGINDRPHKPRPRVPAKIMAWFEDESPVLRSMVLTADQRAASMKTTIAKFACITPAVVTRDMDQLVLGYKGVEVFKETDLRLSAPVRYAPFMPKAPPLDPWHESRMRLSIQFPDKRLLQYDCGKLQALERLLRKLQSGGHRALIFTQMTKVLDILEQFLNIHGHKYLRLDGATKVEQRQILTDRFNNDTRILVFILSTRSGGLGINLTGADTVIFYDQDWNPAMDKQCQDRCHRIGQTRDVHIYRLVSEHTIEANILRKASQKQMLDDVVIQEGGFTTDYFNKLDVHSVMKGVGNEEDADMVGDAMDRVLGGAESSGERAVGRVLEQAEDKEDVQAAHVAEKEIHDDDADFDEKVPTASASGNSSTRQNTPTTRDASAAPGPGRSNLGLFEQTAEEEEIELDAWGVRVKNIDEFMLDTMAKMLEGTPIEFPKDKKKGKKGRDRDRRR